MASKKKEPQPKENGTLSAKRQQVFDLIPSRTKGDGGITSGWPSEDLKSFVRELDIGTIDVILKAAEVEETQLVSHLLCEPEFIEETLIEWVEQQQWLNEYNAQFKFMRDGFKLPNRGGHMATRTKTKKEMDRHTKALRWLNQAIDKSIGMTVFKFIQMDKEAREAYVDMMELVIGKELPKQLRKDVMNFEW